MPLPRWSLVVVLALLGSGLSSTGVRADEPPQITGVNQKAVAEVASGARAEARAAWWGFDPRESTRALQSAIDSRARKIIVENMGSPWIVDEIRLRGDLEIVFEPGVVVQAKRGAFLGGNASLFRAANVKNLTLRGPGATLKMWREDYDDPQRYKKAEWRHVLDFRSCCQLRVEGLTLSDSGGDGIYLGVSAGGGPNTDVHVTDVVCERNYRQGISVISARGLTIERCALKSTVGTAPMAGIDFEPNHAREEITDCVLRDCLVENNAGAGFQFYLRPLGRSSRPVSVRLERCRTSGNAVGIALDAGSHAPGETIRGTVVAEDCEFQGDKTGGLRIGPKPADGIAARFARCRIVNAAADQPRHAPIQLLGESDGTNDAGGVALENCVVVDRLDRRPIAFFNASGVAKLINVTGSLIVERADRRETIPLDQALIDAWFPLQAFRRFPAYPGANGPFEPIATAGTAEGSCNVRQRGKAEWLVWAEAGDEVSLTIQIQSVGKAEPPDAPIAWFDPSGTETKLGKVAGTRVVTFRAGTTGAQRIVCDPGPATASIPRSNRRVAMIASDRPKFHLIGPAGDLYFLVPSGTGAFAARVSGDGPGESVKATLRDPAGKTIAQHDNVETRQFLVDRPVSTSDEVWSLRLERPSRGVLEDVYVTPEGLPPILATRPEALMKPARRPVKLP